MELNQANVEWAVAAGHCPIGTTRVIVLDDGQWICEGAYWNEQDRTSADLRRSELDRARILLPSNGALDG